jgi:peptidoglycan hydrolase-like protein with peptidoglycan-binding domain
MVDAISLISSAVTTALTQGIPSPPPGSSAALAFQPIGLPIDPTVFQSNSLQAADATDALADVTAKVVDGQYFPTLVSATGLFDLLLSGVAATVDGAATYGQLLNQAQETFYIGSTDTVASPGNWWDPSATGWTTYATSSGQATGPVQIGPITAAPWTWRVLPPSHQSLAASSPPSLFRPIAEFPVIRATAAGTAELASPVAVAPAAPAAVVVAPSHLLGIARGQIIGLASISTPTPVQADQVSISFEYMMVALTRSWWNGPFIADPAWYLPGYQAGQLAPGSVAGTGGICGGLPTAMVLVRNLTISGSWTASDQSALVQASTFGPFSLLGRTIGVDYTVQVTGTQIVAWVVTELPQLPPLGDPSLSPPAAAADPLAPLPVLAKGATGPFVERAQALLGVLLGPGTPALPVTSTFDAATVQAVDAFQNATHITATGEVDLATWHQLIGI